MACDLVVALGRATVDGHTLVGQNTACSPRRPHTLTRLRGRAFTCGEKVRTQFLELPQVRQTYDVLGSRPAGCWGLEHGVNEHQVAAGCAALPPAPRVSGPGLLGSDLVRIVLERCRTARQGIELLTDLIEEYGQGSPASSPEDGEDYALLVADPTEAFALEAAGRRWVYQQVHQVRAVSNVRLIRQDWDRISQGLGEHAITQGWWPDDGSKVDFTQALGAMVVGRESGYRRWGRATLLLEQQNGHIDPAFLRLLLSDHYEDTPDERTRVDDAEPPQSLCGHAGPQGGTTTAASLITDLSPDPAHPSLLWCAFGPPCCTVYFPVFLEAELPPAYVSADDGPGSESLWWRVERLIREQRQHPLRWQQAQDRLAALQAHLEQEAVEFAAEAAVLRQRGEDHRVQRLASLLLEHNLERFEAVVSSLRRTGEAEPVLVATAAPGTTAV